MATITRQQQQLNQLTQRIKQLSELSKQVNSSHTTTINYKLRDRALFYPGLFIGNSHDIQQYMAELEKSMTRLQHYFDKSVDKQATNTKQPSSSPENTLSIEDVLLEKVAHQFRAINGVLRQCHFRRGEVKDEQTNYAVIAKKLLQKSHYLYQKLAQQIEYERRLQAMIDQQTDPLQLQQTRQRLQRCQAATAKVRQQLQRYEQKKDLM
ncbi:primosomal replication protein [Moritella sp. 5]|uniref:primosomal replication protein PriC n=1 Tax=Moritella sp. 5 TaxID=2746231 RepID=UPI001BA5D480|nr:primosomal replication protein PriC [Moritella sp. 5]QUM81488.1 primosomal replication protein [Moritella sp. 5]